MLQTGKGRNIVHKEAITWLERTEKYEYTWNQIGCSLELLCPILLNNPRSPLILSKISEANPRLAQEQCKMLKPG